MTRAERVERAIKQARKLRHLARAEATHYMLMSHAEKPHNPCAKWQVTRGLADRYAQDSK